MSSENIHNTHTVSVLESLTKTLLYEGYSLFPYYRMAIKNQKPIPFGVVFPLDYNAQNENSHSHIQSQTIITGNDDLIVNITIRFLHLRRIEILQYDKENNNNIVPVNNLNAYDKSYHSGWQTIERVIITGDIVMTDLVKNGKTISVEFGKKYECENIYAKNNEVIGNEVINVSAIDGAIYIIADELEPDVFRVTVSVTNTTAVENATSVKRDDALLCSFLSTHIILQAQGGEFISHQDPEEKWKEQIAQCNNIHTWPILIDKSNSTLLCSPIIVYDYPEINPQSSGDLFDSTEIEEALLLHVNILSDEEKKRIGGNDEKLQAMLNKVTGMTPEDLNVYHSMMKNSAPGEFNNK